jgi:hypothetical protein
MGLKRNRTVVWTWLNSFGIRIRWNHLWMRWWTLRVS